ncbi:hypothetical protein [Paraburkholderia sp. RL18-085-BIA-A]|uniref:hypothetical protein n=1 Tax=Paraburkholderia sp. RL18-085-BIA-A TaxID=3031633 RepID=UPI0038BB300C
MKDRQTVGIEPGSEDCRTNPEHARDAAAATSTAKGTASAAEADRRPNWNRWAHISEATIRELVSLSENIDPDKVEWGRGAEFGTAPAESQSFNDRLFVAARNAGIGKPLAIVSGPSENPTIDATIMVEEFVAWAAKNRWRLPAALVEFFGEYNPPYDPYWDSPSASRSVPSKWPWGDHDTRLLRQMDAAAQKFWSLYDPADPSTAPTNKDVVEWLVTQKVTERTAEAMATILRANDLPAGRRKK